MGENNEKSLYLGYGTEQCYLFHRMNLQFERQLLLLLFAF